ncbi:hypothetical protein CCAL9344_08000 [Campylobacter sp. RM9344]|uniref:Uncharacterized protein n=1 Tax=Campylobacter californiensis TaxID=1032243 RepID=A0AAW3ZWR6_9BACT|nr:MULTISPECIES: hypothetical protein [unclassified Campylobacter]MBE2985343.1 hypothetical protein [Campylobacter sp. RM6883]MBE2995876.1 hypothetical protein [Campylobacter sp. RM6913]MBE3030120.1 hypothetical protein [Campylobacter sp. RM9344]MBE3608761.1 hypothetical protein [Campylobacter sp. RM9337]QCD51234.1 hypothetical protein CCAL_1349 [Campylobacter sp. RM6914]
MIKKAVIILDPISPEIYFVDENNKRASENIQAKALTTINEIGGIAHKLEIKLRKQEIDNKQGSLEL